jgi:hypothetical protein
VYIISTAFTYQFDLAMSSQLLQTGANYFVHFEYMFGVAKYMPGKLDIPRHLFTFISDSHCSCKLTQGSFAPTNFYLTTTGEDWRKLFCAL